MVSENDLPRLPPLEDVLRAIKNSCPKDRHENISFDLPKDKNKTGLKKSEELSDTKYTNCPILSRATGGDGRIAIRNVGKDVVCEYFRTTCYSHKDVSVCGYTPPLEMTRIASCSFSSRQKIEERFPLFNKHNYPSHY